MSKKAFTESNVGSELERFILHHARLQPGDKLEGKVIQVRHDNRILIDFGSFRALADAQFTIPQGEIINVVVVARIPKLKLRLEAPGNQISPNARQVIRRLEMAPEERWNNISETIDNLYGFERTGRVGEWLFPPSLRETVDEVNPHARLRNLGTGKIAVLFNLGVLGNIRVDFYMLNKNLSITFYASREDTAAVLNAHLPQVDQIVAPRFEHLVLNVFQSERKISDFDIENLEVPITLHKMLDVKI